MSEDDNNKRLGTITEEDLVREIEKHNRLYWEKGEPEISDDEYDDLIRRLKALNPDHPLIYSVQAPEVASSGKVVHSKPMLSLDKAYSLEEVLEWARKHARTDDELLEIQPKYDGISANYLGGILATRGDGQEGENVTDKIPLIELETKGYRGPLNRPARGEIVIRDDDFKSIYSNIMKKNGQPYKNSRNAVSGIMGLKEIDDMIAQGAKLTLIDYNMVSYSVKLNEMETKWPEIVAEVENLPFPMDGIVIKIADQDYSDSLGNTAHHPRGQIAFKFSGIRKTTRLLGVTWSFGKNCLTPVAELEPVDISGITIKHATLHNAANIIEKDVHIGDTVTIERAGDVIPYIISAEPGPERKTCLISRCPCCDSELTMDGPELCCKNPECFETNLQRLLAAVKNIGIERLGEPNIRKMMNNLGVKSLRDIFDLKITDILTLDGFKEKSASNLFKEIQNARKVNDYQLLASLNISGIGPTVAKTILSEFTLEELRCLNEDQLSNINGIGPERAGALLNELDSQRDILDELLKCLEVKQTKSAEKVDRPTICFTGKMPEKRSHYHALAEQHGYEPVDSVTGTLDILVAQDITGGGGKLDKARKAGTTIMALDEWLNSLENASEQNSMTPQVNSPSTLDAEDLPLFTDSENPAPVKSDNEKPDATDGLDLFDFANQQEKNPD